MTIVIKNFNINFRKRKLKVKKVSTLKLSLRNTN